MFEITHERQLCLAFDGHCELIFVNKHTRKSERGTLFAMNTPGYQHLPTPATEPPKNNGTDSGFSPGTTPKPSLFDINVSADKQLAEANIDNPHDEVKVE